MPVVVVVVVVVWPGGVLTGTTSVALGGETKCTTLMPNECTEPPAEPSAPAAPSEAASASGDGGDECDLRQRQTPRALHRPDLNG